MVFTISVTLLNLCLLILFYLYKSISVTTSCFTYVHHYAWYSLLPYSICAYSLPKQVQVHNCGIHNHNILMFILVNCILDCIYEHLLYNLKLEQKSNSQVFHICTDQANQTWLFNNYWLHNI